MIVMLIVRYPVNILLALINLLGATLFLYRPNGDGWVHSWWYCLDCTGNALAFGDPYETISSRAGKARANGRPWACVLCAVLGYVASLIMGKPTDHCAQSIEPDEGARAIIPDGE